MGAGLYQRRSAARVTFTPASQPYVRRRSRGARRRDLLVLLTALGLVAAAVWTATHLRLASPIHAEALVPLSAGAAKVELPVFAASGPSEAAQSLLAPPYSWDYRWAESNPAVGAPAVRARSAVLVDLETRRVLFSRQPHVRRPLASTTKLTTAMVALDHAAPDATVIVPDTATTVEPDVMGLTPGEQLSVRELLYGLLLDSGNDAAETLAVTTTAGGRAAFVHAMNVKAAALGLTDTHFANPSGLDDPNQYSSAHDLALTAAYLYQHYPFLAQVVSTKQETLPYSSHHKAFFPTNFDKLLWTFPGAIGFKTGLTDAAGQVFVGGAQRGSHTLLTVEMDDPLIFTDAAALLDYGFRREG
jgi:D-alanyl-D-alanine carboxypeptidase (penicillin-binding protein 5/6)